MGGGETEKPKDPPSNDIKPTGKVIQYKNIIATMNAF